MNAMQAFDTVNHEIPLSKLRNELWNMRERALLVYHTWTTACRDDVVFLKALSSDRFYIYCILIIYQIAFQIVNQGWMPMILT